MGELMGMVFSRISTIFMVACLAVGVDDEVNNRRHQLTAPMLIFLSLMP
jgi:hypothetical protein